MKTKLLALSSAFLISACSRAPQPLASGNIVRVTLGDKPVMRAGETGSWGGRTFTEGRIHIYDRVVVVVEKDGTKHAAPTDWFSQMVFK